MLLSWLYTLRRHSEAGAGDDRDRLLATVLGAVLQGLAPAAAAPALGSRVLGAWAVASAYALVVALLSLNSARCGPQAPSPRSGVRSKWIRLCDVCDVCSNLTLGSGQIRNRDELVKLGPNTIEAIRIERSYFYQISAPESPEPIWGRAGADCGQIRLRTGNLLCQNWADCGRNRPNSANCRGESARVGPTSTSFGRILHGFSIGPMLARFRPTARRLRLNLALFPRNLGHSGRRHDVYSRTLVEQHSATLPTWPDPRTGHECWEAPGAQLGQFVQEVDVSDSDQYLRAPNVSHSNRPGIFDPPLTSRLAPSTWPLGLVEPLLGAPARLLSR